MLSAAIRMVPYFLPSFHAYSLQFLRHQTPAKEERKEKKTEEKNARETKGLMKRECEKLMEMKTGIARGKNATQRKPTV